ncbi:hypothetical protein DB891_04490 [Flavobacterium laiguense]|uniref:SnoaL-like domain-containing protein n=1 Tax=Flavobacterium laiguense TaxID=2169409 RepID=A0A2U1JZX3_9FLAO|nr:hypothetical protein DB891_04490 [Flavobacterium laiguense]
MNNIFELEQLTHLVLAQYHRWYQVYEVPFTEERIKNQKDILSDDVEISSQLGTTKGKEGLEDRLKVYTGWQNAHHVKHTEVQLLPDGQLSLEADILYQNIRPDNSKYSYTLHYSTELQPRENDLPLFTKLDLKPTGEVKEFIFEDAYPENRVKSFMHYWLYLMENPNSDKFRELLAADFALQLSAGQNITALPEFDEWMKSISSRILTSSHSYNNLKIVDNEDNTFTVFVDFDWKGININNEKMIAETHHEWLLTNNMEERFARMKTMKVTIIKPFQVVTDF